jgi:hypothetical protein
MDTTASLVGQMGNNTRAPLTLSGSAGFNDVFETSLSNPASPSPAKDGKGRGKNRSAVYPPSSAPAMINFDSFDKDISQTSLPDLYPNRGNRHNENVLLLHDGRAGDASNDVGEGGFVLRGGFRMPRPAT